MSKSHTRLITIDAIDADLLLRNTTGTSIHRAVMERKLGRPLEPGEVVDHINRVPHDHRRDNLRVATLSQNQMNRGPTPHNKSGYKGVHWSKQSKKWVAQVGYKGKSIVVGKFDDPAEAHAAYVAKARELHGDYLPPAAAMRKEQSA